MSSKLTTLFTVCFSRSSVSFIQLGNFRIFCLWHVSGEGLLFFSRSRGGWIICSREAFFWCRMIVFNALLSYYRVHWWTQRHFGPYDTDLNRFIAAVLKAHCKIWVCATIASLEEALCRSNLHSSMFASFFSHIILQFHRRTKLYCRCKPLRKYLFAFRVFTALFLLKVFPSSKKGTMHTGHQLQIKDESKPTKASKENKWITAQ